MFRPNRRSCFQKLGVEAIGVASGFAGESGFVSFFGISGAAPACTRLVEGTVFVALAAMLVVAAGGGVGAGRASRSAISFRGICSEPRKFVTVTELVLSERSRPVIRSPFFK